MTVADLIACLQTLEPTDVLHKNYVGNLIVERGDDPYIAWVDLNLGNVNYCTINANASGLPRD